MVHEIREVGDEQLAEFLEPLFTALGLNGAAEAASVYAELGHDLRLAAYADERIVGTAALFDFEMTVPGGNAVRTAGVTLVGVRPAQRRRGILRELMQRCLQEARARARPLSALFATDGAIYGRFGYGLASWWLNVHVERPSDLLLPRPVPGQFRQLDSLAAERRFPAIWEQARARRPGMLSRTPAWWRQRRVAEPSWRRQGRAELQNVLYEVSGAPLAYAIYRHGAGFERGLSVAKLEIVEAIGLTPEAEYAIWQYLFSLDLVHSAVAPTLNVDHPLRFMVPEPARLAPKLDRALYVRVLDVPEALRLRAFAPSGAVVLGIQDELCPWNTGHFQVAASGVERTSAQAELRLDVRELGSVYLGGVSFGELLAAGLVQELVVGAAARADALFVRGPAPWCPDIF